MSDQWSEVLLQLIAVVAFLGFAAAFVGPLVSRAPGNPGVLVFGGLALVASLVGLSRGRKPRG